ncbi:AI-2E family transporter [Tissierella creatinophila]|uniref:AI-2 transport protein TqsA n=1 Tax=Tissierella creatinophila DSM 6911 TaxID=1123403 RepID=A0A1U7M9A9_TISCR|nr:AI-2E family transporter [Tissierella creatinophila]OLS03902.1 AI-2 transport protein TqsA [Tissierella creatinophila DSM 6911]
MIGQGSPDIFIKAIGILSITLTFLVIYYLINIGNRFVENSKKINIQNKWIIITFLALIFAYFLYVFLKRNPFLYDIFITTIISIILAYTLNPLINKLEKRGINRLEGVLILYISILGIFFILAFLIIPKSGREIKRLVTDLPMYFDRLSDLVDKMYTKYYSILGGLPPMFKDVEKVVMENIIKIENVFVNGLKNFVGAIIGMTSKIINIILTPILTLYFLVDKDYFVKKIKGWIPKKHKKDIIYLATTIDNSLSKFIKGRLLMSLYVGIFTSIILFILGVDFAFVIGLVTGIFDIVPYIGPLMGFIPALFFGFVESPIKAIWVSILFVVIQWGENNILAPKIIGENMGIHPLVILLSIIIGGGIFGVFGMIISVPLVAVLKIIYEFIKEKRLIYKDRKN